LSAHHLEQSALDRGEHAGELVAAFEDLAVLAVERPHALTLTQRGALLDAHLRDLGGAAEGGEGGVVLAEVHRIVAPLARGDHAAVEIEDAHELGAVEADLAGSRRRRCATRKRDDVAAERRSAHQASVPLLRLGVRSARSAAISSRKPANSRSSASTRSAWPLPF